MSGFVCVETFLGWCRGAEEQAGEAGMQQWACSAGSAVRAPFWAAQVGHAARSPHTPMLASIRRPAPARSMFQLQLCPQSEHWL